jgi:hypothetical protein
VEVEEEDMEMVRVLLGFHCKQVIIVVCSTLHSQQLFSPLGDVFCTDPANW